MLNTQLPAIKAATDGAVARLVLHSQSFVVNVPQGFHVYVFCSGPSLVEDHALPDAMAQGTASITLQAQEYTMGNTKSDNSVDHTFVFAQRVEVFGADMQPIPAGVLRFVARAELIRI
jgi:hypothetical protein